MPLVLALVVSDVILHLVTVELVVEDGTVDKVLILMVLEMMMAAEVAVQDMYIHHLQLKIILKDVCLIRHIILLTLKR